MLGQKYRFLPKRSAPWRKAHRHTGNSDRAFPFALRWHRPAPTRRSLGARPLPWLLRRRQRSRALVLELACELWRSAAVPTLTARFAAFIQHAWNPDTRRFRNFMSYDRRWLEKQGSEDSHGRTLWALGECARKDADQSRRRWARGAVQDCASRRRGILVAARLGVLAPWVGRLLHTGRRRRSRQPTSQGCWPTG